MRIELRHDEFLTDGDLQKLSRLSDKGLKRLYKKYNYKAADIGTALRIIMQNKVAIEPAELAKLTTKKKRYGWIGFDVWALYIRRTVHISDPDVYY